MIGAFVWLVNTIIQLIIILLIVNAVISWLVAFDVISRRNRFVSTVWDMTTRLTDPMLRPIRNVIPSVGGLDLSPMVLILGLGFVQVLLRNIL
ncbi:MAG: YggT family protein [Caulobacterales bacterium]